MIEEDHPQLSVRRQCALLGLARASLYYAPQGESPENVQLMRLLDEQYTATPLYGVRRMTARLRSSTVSPRRLELSFIQIQRSQ